MHAYAESENFLFSTTIHEILKWATCPQAFEPHSPLNVDVSQHQECFAVILYCWYYYLELNSKHVRNTANRIIETWYSQCLVSACSRFFNQKMKLISRIKRPTRRTVQQSSTREFSWALQDFALFFSINFSIDFVLLTWNEPRLSLLRLSTSLYLTVFSLILKNMAMIFLLGCWSDSGIRNL